MPIIYHIAFAEDWNLAKQKGEYKHPTLKSEGFIHCSLDHQVQGVLDRYFKGKTGIVKLVIDTEKLTSRFVFDWSQSTADTYPHIYGPINTDAVIEAIAI